MMTLRAYYQRQGVVILTVLALTALWSVYDAQAGIYTPGWFSMFHRNVWCQTVVTLPGIATSEFQHYPGKTLARVMKDFNVPDQIRGRMLRAKEKETTCYATWREAAMADRGFQHQLQAYPGVTADWPEERYQQAIQMMFLQKGGRAKLDALLAAEYRARKRAEQP